MQKGGKRRFPCLHVILLVLMSVAGVCNLVAAPGEVILFDDFQETWGIGSSGRPADDQGREYGRDEGAASSIPSPFPFNDSVKFHGQVNMRGGRVNPTDTTYFTRSHYMMQPLTRNESSMTYLVEGAQGFEILVSEQFFGEDPRLGTEERIAVFGSVDGSDGSYENIATAVEVVDVIGVNHLVRITNRAKMGSGHRYFKLGFTLKNDNFWEILVLSVSFTGTPVNGDAIATETFDARWPVDSVAINESGQPDYKTGGRLPLVKADDPGQGRILFSDTYTMGDHVVSFENLVNGRVNPDPRHFTYNDWMLILSAQRASIVCTNAEGFENFSIVAFRQIWDNSLPTEEAIKLFVSSDGSKYEQVSYDTQILKTNGTDHYLGITNKSPLAPGNTFLKIELLHHQDKNLYELGISSIRLMNGRSLGVPKFSDTFSNQWPVDSVVPGDDGKPNYKTGGRLPYVDPNDSAKGRLAFSDTFSANEALIQYSGLVNGRVNPDPANFQAYDWLLILADTKAGMTYEYADGFTNFSLDIFRQVWNESLPLREAVKVSVSNDGKDFEEVHLSAYTTGQSDVNRMFKVFNKQQLVEPYRYLKIEFSHHNRNFWELGISGVKLYHDTPDTVGEVDREAPTLSVDWNLASTMDKNSTVTLPKATAIDNSDAAPVVAVEVRSPYESIVSLRDNQFMLTARGVYTIAYSAEDSHGNIAKTSYTIEAVEPAPVPVESTDAAQKEPSALSATVIVLIVAGVVVIVALSGFAIKRRKNK